MSGGRLVVLDRLGRDVKTYHLKEGLATLGSDPVCDIRFMLPTVSPHHATVAVHTKQTVVHSACAEPTLVNGSAVSVAALRHGDEISLGGRRLRWEYADAGARRPLAPQPALARRSVRAGRARRHTGPATRLAVAPPLRASMTTERTRASWRSGDAAPSSGSGIQVAIVQPLRRDAGDQQETISKSVVKPPKRSRASRPDDDREDEQRPEPSSVEWSEGAGGGAGGGGAGEASTKASLWCESRRTPHKIHDPPRIDHTKQAAIMLMTGHTPKNRSPKARASLVVKRTSPVRRTPRRARSSPRWTPGRGGGRGRGRGGGSRSISILEIGSGSRRFDVTLHQKSPLSSPILGNPKKSALKDPSVKKTTRKTESIKFDLSNLESSQERSSDVFLLNETTNELTNDDVSEDNLTLHYSESSTALSPSPRKSSRSSKILEKSLGTSVTYSTIEQITLTPRESPRSVKSLRGSVILKKALENSRSESRLSRNSKMLSDQSYATVRSDRKSRSLRTTDVESYSVVDLISLDSNDSKSVYDSAGSTVNSLTFASPQIAARRTRSGKPSLLGSSTPYGKTDKKAEISNISKENTMSDNLNNRSRRSASLTTPENTESGILLNSTKISKASKSRSRINDSDILLLDEDEDASPRSSRRGRVGGPTPRKNISIVVDNESPMNSNGTVTPENEHSPKEAGTPVLSIQTLLDESNKLTSSSVTLELKRNGKRKTFSDVPSIKRARTSIKSKSFNFDHRRTTRGVDDSGSYSKDEEKVVTPRSAVKLVHEAVKNKHSTAKKPKSKRSIIDNLDSSDIVKHLFNSPVKRNLSQSMTKLLHWQDDDASPIHNTKRHTVALTGRTPDNSLLDTSTQIAPEVFVSPLNTSSDSSVLSRVKRLFRKETPENDLRDVRGVKTLLRTPRVKKSIKNDLTNVSGVKKVFARSPKNRLSDVRIKEMFAPSPSNDLRRVHGVKALFKSVENRNIASPDVRGVRNLFKGSPKNDLGNISGVKLLDRRSPKNDLRSIKGVKDLFREEKQHGLSDVSGVEELFEEPSELDKAFDQLLGKPRPKSYGKSKSLLTANVKRQKRSAKSLHDSLGAITNNVEEWLQREIKRCVQKAEGMKSIKSNTSTSNVTKELQKLTTNTVAGNTPLRLSRVRNSTMVKSTRESSSIKQSSLPIKKRSITETSLNRSGNTSKLLRLPIKKRMLVHSTPVKGRMDITLNNTELGRMSPIASVEKAPQIVTTINAASFKESTTITKIGKNGEKNRLPEIESIQSPPRKTRNIKVKPTTPIQPRATRGKKAAESKLPTVIKKRKSITITKKPPILSPKPEKVNKDNQSSSKRQTRTTRIIEAKKTIAASKGSSKTRRASLVISKLTPDLNPQNDNQRATKTARVTRKTKASEVKVMKSQVQNQKTPEPKASITKTGKKGDNIKEAMPEKTTRTRRNQNANVEFNEIKIKSQGARKTQVGSSNEQTMQDNAKKEVSKRNRRTVVTTIPEVAGKENVIEAQTKRARKSQKESNINIVSAKGVNKKQNTKEFVLEPVAKTRGRKTIARDETIEATTKRGRPLRGSRNLSEVLTKSVTLKGGKKNEVSSNGDGPIREERRGRRSKKVTISEDIEVVVVKKQRGKGVSNQGALEDPQPGGKATRQTSRRTITNEAAAESRKTRAKAETQAASTSTTSRKRKSKEDVKDVPPTAKRRKLPAISPAPEPQAETRSGRSRRR